MKAVNPLYEYFEIDGDLPVKQRNYYKVLAKCGHVGKGYYFEGKFYIAAESASKAAFKARKFPRVKHDHKDAIISVTPITYKEYVEGQNLEYSRPYYNCLSIQDQNRFWEDISKDIHQDSESDDMVKVRKRHTLKNIYNQDPLYQELKLYRGNIDWIYVA